MGITGHGQIKPVGSVDDKELLFPGDAGTGVSERPLVLGVVLVFFVLPVWC